MKKFFLLFLGVVLICSCEETIEVCAPEMISSHDFNPSSGCGSDKNLGFIGKCECNGQTYLPASIELVSYD